MRGPLRSALGLGTLVLAGALPGLTFPAAATLPRQIFGQWGSFQVERPRQCYAMTAATTVRPDLVPGGTGLPPAGPISLAISYWPGRPEGEVQLHLPGKTSTLTRSILSIGESHFPMRGYGDRAWPENPAMDRAIIAAMRRADWARLAVNRSDGERASVYFSFDGAASAIDAAAIACLQR